MKMSQFDKERLETPSWLFNMMNDEFHFDVDVAATKENSKCPMFISPQSNALKMPWIGNVWCNPPYKRGELGLWIKKGYIESRKAAKVVVMLVKAVPGTKYWNEWALKAFEIRFIQGRVLFELDGKPILDDKGRKVPGEFDSSILVFKNQEKYPPISLIKQPN